MTFSPSGIAGAYIKEMSSMNKEEAFEFSTLGIELINSLINYDNLVLTVSDKYLFGGGLELILASDIRLTTPECKFGFPEVTLGIIPGFFGIELSMKKCSPLCDELILTGNIFKAKEKNNFTPPNVRGSNEINTREKCEVIEKGINT